MKEKLALLGQRISAFLGLDMMGKSYSTLTGVYLFLMIYTTLESVFVNTLLYKISSEMSYVMLYRGITYVAAAVAMHIAAYISKKLSPIWVVRLGAMLYLVMYMLLFFGMDNMEVVRHPLAVLSGAAGAFYWSGHNALVLGYTNRQNRDVGISILGMISGIITLLVPVIAGFVISGMPGIWGYRVMFGMGMLAVAVQVYFSFRLAPLPQRGKKRSYFGLALQLIRQRSAYRLMLLYEVFRGCRDGVFAFILNMLLFEIITNEGLTGVNTFLTGIMAILGSYVYGKLVTPDKRTRFMVLSTTVLLLTGSILYAAMNVGTLMFFTVVNAFFQLFFINICNNSTYDLTSHSRTARRCSSEMYAIREIALATGRLIGLGVMSAFPATQFGYVTVMLLLTALQYVTALLMKQAGKKVRRKRQAA